ncbi:MAG: hypothetical protein H7318_13640 [Oligoflexus sp.]|nr:hypothetical protein [Oligoflexus sp.]
MLLWLPIFPANLAFGEAVIPSLTQERQYIAQVVRKAFGLFKEQVVLSEFITLALKDCSLAQGITQRAKCSKDEINELESRIAECFIIETNYLDLKSLQDSHLKIRDRSTTLADRTANSLGCGSFLTKA